MRISDWSSDVCSSDLLPLHFDLPTRLRRETRPRRTGRTPRGYPRPHGGRRPDSARDAALPMAFLDSCDRSDSGARRGDMRLALYQPDIAGNVGTILRLAACLGVGVDLIEPMGFAFSDRELARAGMDYSAQAAVTRTAESAAFAAGAGRIGTGKG